MKHLRLFETTTAFEAEKSNLPEPWVALTEDDEKVHFFTLPSIIPHITATYEITENQVGKEVIIAGIIGIMNEVSGGVHPLINGLSPIAKIRVDSGVWFDPYPTIMSIMGSEEKEYLCQSYVFQTSGEHVVEFNLKDPMIMDYGYFEQDEQVTNHYLSILSSMNTMLGEVLSINIPFLKIVTIHSFMELIGDAAFSGCDQLLNITIPNSVTSIGLGAFQSCWNLTNIKYNGTKAQWNAIAKNDYWKEEVPTECIVHCTDGDILINNA